MCFFIGRVRGNEVCIYRDQAYTTRVQLAVLDHNSHTEREVATTVSGDQKYHRKYRRQSKKWDVTPVKCKKDYSYIPQLMATIFEACDESVRPLKSKQSLRQDHPENIQNTIAHIPPELTATIVVTKRSRFSDD